MPANRTVKSPPRVQNSLTVRLLSRSNGSLQWKNHALYIMFSRGT